MRMALFFPCTKPSLWQTKVFITSCLAVLLLCLLYRGFGQRGSGVVRTVDQKQDRKQDTQIHGPETLRNAEDINTLRNAEDRNTLRNAEDRNTFGYITGNVSSGNFPKPEEVSHMNHANEDGKNADTINSNWYAKLEDLPRLDVPVSCPRLFEGDPVELPRALSLNSQLEVPSVEALHLEDCERFKSERGYLTKPVSLEEEEFPLAFAITMFKDPEQTERLLRALYRPQNIYCIHIDEKSEDSVLETMTAVASCFPNVFLTSERANVHWGYFSVLEPELHCIDMLVKHKKWRYLINLTGQEFPLKTNLDMVKIFKVFQGANDVPGSAFSKLGTYINDRIDWVHKEGHGNTKVAKKPFGHNITMAKGSIHMLISREYAEFVATDPVALEFREWSKDCAHPDEFFFNSLEYSPQLGVPGAYTGEPEEGIGVTRWKEWQWFNYKCQGKWVRAVCVLGTGDLPALYHSKALIVNKLHMDFHPLAYDCLEELHFNKTRDEIMGVRNFDVKPYARLKLVKNRQRVLRRVANGTKS